MKTVKILLFILLSSSITIMGCKFSKKNNELKSVSPIQNNKSLSEPEICVQGQNPEQNIRNAFTNVLTSLLKLPANMPVTEKNERVKKFFDFIGVPLPQSARVPIPPTRKDIKDVSTALAYTDAVAYLTQSMLKLGFGTQLDFGWQHFCLAVVAATSNFLGAPSNSLVQLPMLEVNQVGNVQVEKKPGGIIVTKTTFLVKDYGVIIKIDEQNGSEIKTSYSVPPPPNSPFDPATGWQTYPTENVGADKYNPGDVGELTDIYLKRRLNTNSDPGAKGARLLDVLPFPSLDPLKAGTEWIAIMKLPNNVILFDLVLGKKENEARQLKHIGNVTELYAKFLTHSDSGSTTPEGALIFNSAVESLEVIDSSITRLSKNAITFAIKVRLKWDFLLKSAVKIHATAAPSQSSFSQPRGLSQPVVVEKMIHLQVTHP